MRKEIAHQNGPANARGETFVVLVRRTIGDGWLHLVTVTAGDTEGDARFGFGALLLGFGGRLSGSMAGTALSVRLERSGYDGA